MKMQDPTVVFPAPVEMAEALQRDCRQISLTSVSDGPRALFKKLSANPGILAKF